MITTTLPDVKLFIKATDRTRNNNNVLRLGDYVKVQADFSCGCNRPAGYGIIEKVDADFVCVRCTLAYDDSRRRNNIPVSMAFSVVLHQDMMIKSVGRNREDRDESQNDEVKVMMDKRTIT